MDRYTPNTQVHAEASDQGKQGARQGARGTRSLGCTGCTFSIERAPVPRNLDEWAKEVDFILRWSDYLTDGLDTYRRRKP